MNDARTGPSLPVAAALNCRTGNIAYGRLIFGRNKISMAAKTRVTRTSSNIAGGRVSHQSLKTVLTISSYHQLIKTTVCKSLVIPTFGKKLLLKLLHQHSSLRIVLCIVLCGYTVAARWLYFTLPTVSAKPLRPCWRPSHRSLRIHAPHTTSHEGHN